MTIDIDKLETTLFAELAAAKTEAALEELRVSALGKKGSVSELLKGMGAMSPEDRQVFGPKINGLKNAMNDAINAKKVILADAALDARLLAERIDATLPAFPQAMGKIHPIMQVFEEVAVIFADMGFTVKEGPDIKTIFTISRR